MADLPDIKIDPPLKVEASRKREIQVLEKNNFPVCESIYREVSQWFGFKKRSLCIHRTASGTWDVLIID